jgi:serine/threonine protein kinase
LEDRDRDRDTAHHDYSEERERESSESTTEGGYDARETDAWACGVVLYALVARKLPFGEGPGEALPVVNKISGEGGGGGMSGFSPMERRQWLMKIARGEWHWPEHSVEGEDASTESTSTDSGLRGPSLVRSTGAKRAVEKLLVRDPSRRVRVKDLWSDEWVSGGGGGGGAVPAPAINENRNSVEGLPPGSSDESYSSFVPLPMPRVHDHSATEPWRLPSLPSGLPNLPSDSWSPTPSSAFDSVTVTPALTTGGTSYEEDDEEEFDNDRRENGMIDTDTGADESSTIGSPTTDEEDEDELEEEEEDGEGWL